MINHATVEALYSGTYLENYLNCVEQLPDDLQRLISRARELDVTYRAFLVDARQQQEMVLKCTDSISKKKSGLMKIQQLLIAAQEIGDDKLEIIQQIQDMIENKARQLDIDCRNLVEIGKEHVNNDSSKYNSNGSTTTNVTNSNNNNNGNSNNERLSKRMRRTRNDTAQSMDNNTGSEIVSTPEPLRQNQQTTQQSMQVSTTTTTTTNSTQSQRKSNSQGGGGGGGGKKKKRKSRQSANQQHLQREETPPRDDEMAIDPDEPVYCLCHQISYGEMIMCDNDLCPFEWFHFSCVSLSLKPKGKWFCPRCRGDRSSVMKPKSQLNKVTNKEKEMKEDKGT